MANAERTKWIGFDLGGTKMLATVFDAELNPLGAERKKTKAHQGLKSGLTRITQTIREALSAAEVDLEEIAGIGIGCPGPVDMEKGTVLDPPNLGWGEVPMQKHLQREFDRPVVVLNDVDAGVYGEYRFGAAKGCRTALGVFPGTGIGGGCIYDGAILRGRQTSCMEIGHIPVLPNGPLCGCGQRGCLEAVASRLAVAASAARSAYRGDAPYVQKAAGTDLTQIRSSILSDAIDAGDEAIEKIVKDAARHIGIAVAGVVHLISPDIVILGGGLVEAMPELFVKGVYAAAEGRVMPAFSKTFTVVTSKLGDDAVVMGAAAWAKRMLGERS